MTLENNDAEKAINAASSIIGKSIQRKIGLPLGSAYWLGMALVSTVPRDITPDKVQLRSSLIGRLEQVVPVELIEKGADDYVGDLRAKVPFSLNTGEYEHFGEAVLSVPSGRDIVKNLPLDPNERAELDGYRNRQLRAFLTLHEEFSNAGGDVDPKLKDIVDNELS